VYSQRFPHQGRRVYHVVLGRKVFSDELAAPDPRLSRHLPYQATGSFRFEHVVASVLAVEVYSVPPSSLLVLVGPLSPPTSLSLLSARILGKWYL
jgi:hypothetical protein